MANTLTNSGRAGFLTASQGWLAGSVPGTWVPYLVGSMSNVPADIVFLSDISSNSWRARGTYLVSKTVASGIADAADTMIAAVGSAGSATAVYLILVNETGASQTSLVGAVMDTASGLPFLPNGGDVNIVWDDGANKIFKL